MYSANLAVTGILDHTSPEVADVAARLGGSRPSPREFLRAAHHHVLTVIKPIYSLEEMFPVSRIFREARGSCSQRMACLEGLARAHGIGTRVRALFLEGRFWAPRLPLLKPFLRQPSLIPWPQFHLDGAWLDFEEAFAPLPELAAHTKHRFTNRGESMIEAVGHSAVDFFGKLRQSGHPRGTELDLSEFVAEVGETFDSRDELFTEHDPEPSLMGKALFNTVYGGKPIRREPD